MHEHSTTAEMEAQIASTQSETCTVAVVEQSVEIELDIEVNFRLFESLLDL